MGELRDQMVRDMMTRNLAPRTMEAYVDQVAALARHYNKRPDLLSDEEIRAYQRYLLHERKVATSTCQQARCALKFFYTVTASRPGVSSLLPSIRVANKLPEILSREEVQRIIDATTTDRYRLMLMVAYGSGLRLGEMVRLRVSDIDLERRMIRVVQGKGRKDRYTVLAWRLADELEGYYGRHGRPDYWLFAARRDPRRPTDESIAQKAYHKAKRRAGVHKSGGIHALRHAFATHALEDGLDLPTLARMLGHKSVTTTMRYLHLTEKRVSVGISPLDRLVLGPEGRCSKHRR